MAKIVGVFNTAHSPFCYMPPERWNEVRANRSLREDVPMDDLDERNARSERIQNGFATLRAKMAEVKPDVIVDLRRRPARVLRLQQLPRLRRLRRRGVRGSHLRPRRGPFGRAGGTTPHGDDAVSGAPGVAVATPPPRAAWPA